MTIKTVLKYTQDCLSVMDSDEVDGIADTTEALQVASLLGDLYSELINRQDWDWLKRAITLNGAGNPAQPTKLLLPAGIKRVKHIWYNVSEDDAKVDNRELRYCPLEEFLSIHGRGSSDDVLVEFGNNASFYVNNTKMPTYYTVFSDNTVFCNSYDSSVETSLVNDKVTALGFVIPEFNVQDDFIPDLPEHMVPLLQHSLNEAASVYFNKAASPIDTSRIKRQLSQARKNDGVLTKDTSYYSANYGRR